MTRVAMVGAGSRAVAHMVSLLRIPDVEIVGLTDLNEDICRSAQERVNTRRPPDSRPLDAPIFTDFRRMIETVDPDCLYLSLPPFVHHELDHTAIEYGYPIFFEKPVATDIAIAKEIAAHVRHSGIIHTVGYQMRYSSAVQQGQALLNGVTIGMVVSIRLGSLGSAPWWRVQKHSGGMLIEQHTHAVDLMRLLCGEIETAYAVAGTRLLTDVPNVDIFDVNACTVHFANGAPGIIGNSCAAGFGADLFPGHMVHIVGKDLVLSVHPDKTMVRRSDAPLEEIAAEEDATYLMNRAFITAVRTGDQSQVLSDYDEALRTFAVTFACQLSAETGQVVAVADLLT